MAAHHEWNGAGNWIVLAIVNRTISMLRKQHKIVLIISITLGVLIFFSSNHEGAFGGITPIFRACNVSFFLLYLYACFLSDKKHADNTFKLITLMAVILYMFIYFFISIFLYESALVDSPILQPINFHFKFFLLISVIVFCAVISYQVILVLRNRKNLESRDKI